MRESAVEVVDDGQKVFEERFRAEAKRVLLFAHRPALEIFEVRTVAQPAVA